ncbi:unnamed protein product [Protopolystoma xenopodis]|uniref:dihydropyrimidinase n=1 Tax=Protopolystoma xenopodis TaxID=117903 RepID=A0A448X314_9PLAT|nr:unnamed protein product [Protopolystoma xenopodis]
MSKGWLDLPSFVKVTSSHPAQLCGLYPSKGRLAVGCDADLAIWPGGGLLEPSYYGSQPGDLKTHQDPVGVPAAGSARSPMLVILNGKVVVKAGQIVGADALVAGEGLSDACRQAGRYQAASAFPRHIYRLVFASEHVS